MKTRLSSLPLLLVAAAVSLLPSTASSQSIQLDSAGWQAPALSLVTEDSVAEAIEQEKFFSRRYNVSAPAGENWFEVKAGKSRVLVVAGHATAQMRDGKTKGADRGTGSLALMLNKLADAPVIYTTYESPSDPNYYDDNAFKAAVSTLLRDLKPVLVLDLHTSRADRPYDVDLGTMHGQSLVGREDLAARLQASLEAAGLQNISHDFFPAEKHQTITKWVSRQGVPCIQIENNTTRLAHASDNLAESERFAQLLQGLIRFIRDVDAGQPN
jgi:hypothetical protein